MDVSTVLTFIKQVAVTFLTLIMMIVPTGSGTAELMYEAEDPDALILSLSVVSDIHVETNNPEAYESYAALLKGIKAGQHHDAAVFLGDNVMNGQLLENFFFYTALAMVKPAEEIIVLAGNHDLGNNDGDYANKRENYLKNNKSYLGYDLENTYYYRVINGCYLIVLASEDETTWDFKMSDEQYAWLEQVLDEADAADAPVFVFNHYPLYYLRERDSNQLAALMKEHGVLLFAHGHIHNDMGADNFYTHGGINCVNLPRSTEVVEYEGGDGIVVELYEDELLVRARNFINGEWVEDLVYTYPIAD